MSSFDAQAAAQFIADAHHNRRAFENLSGTCAPTSIDEAYDAQEALVALWEPKKGPVVGLKIATTTKVMQALMGIDHPCGGMIYESTVQSSPAVLNLSQFVHPVIECELAVRLGQDLPKKDTPYTAEEVRAAVRDVMAAFEIIEDRNAVYKETAATSLIADNAWNGGIVLGQAQAAPKGFDLNHISAHVHVTDAEPITGQTDDPMGALAWVANLAISRNRPMTAGMVVITGSVVATFPVTAGQEVRFRLDNVGDVALTTVA